MGVHTCILQAQCSGQDCRPTSQFDTLERVSYPDACFLLPLLMLVS